MGGWSPHQPGGVVLTGRGSAPSTSPPPVVVGHAPGPPTWRPVPTTGRRCRRQHLHGWPGRPTACRHPLRESVALLSPHGYRPCGSSGRTGGGSPRLRLYQDRSRAHCCFNRFTLVPPSGDGRDDDRLVLDRLWRRFWTPTVPLDLLDPLPDALDPLHRCPSDRLAERVCYSSRLPGFPVYCVPASCSREARWLASPGVEVSFPRP